MIRLSLESVHPSRKKLKYHLIGTPTPPSTTQSTYTHTDTLWSSPQTTIFLRNKIYYFGSKKRKENKELKKYWKKTTNSKRKKIKGIIIVKTNKNLYTYIIVKSKKCVVKCLVLFCWLELKPTFRQRKSEFRYELNWVELRGLIDWSIDTGSKYYLLHRSNCNALNSQKSGVFFCLKSTLNNNTTKKSWDSHITRLFFFSRHRIPSSYRFVTNHKTKI